MSTSTPLTHEEVTYSYVGAIVEELARAGVRHACLCPGSRSTPLALTLAARTDIESWVHIDERSAAFFALGLARSTGSAVALVCTSGTAAANFLPAIVEARYSRVPLIVLTADRPPELRDNGAPQAIDQIHLYGGNVKWFVEMAIPDAGEAVVRYARTTAARAVATALAGPAGPVHLNLPFREPLIPPPGGLPAPPCGRADGQPYAEVIDPEPERLFMAQGFQATLDALAHELAARRGVIVCGAQSTPLAGDSLLALARALDYPVLADPLSGIRHGPHGDPWYLIDAYDAFLRDERATERFAPEAVLHFGTPPTSKALQTLMRTAERYVLVDPDGGWRDPIARASSVIHAPARTFIEFFTASLQHYQGMRRLRTADWSEAWYRANQRAREAIGAYLEALNEPFEGRVFAELAELLPDGATLFAGNSMPVRDMETFFHGGKRAIRCLSNRGANGIDGVVSSALGVAAGGGTPLVLVIGDLSFYHDMNGLLAARRYGIDATIVLLNNDGGGIFSFLPQASHPEHFERLFGTPTGLDFQPAVEMYGCGYERVETWPRFRAALTESLSAPGVQVIEMRSDRARNVTLHREIWTAVAEAVWRA